MDNTVQKTAEIQLPDTQRRDYIFFALALLFSLICANGVWMGGFAAGFAFGVLALLITTLCYLGKSFKANTLSIVSLISSFTIILSFAVHETTTFSFFKLNFLILSLSVYLVSAYGIKAPELCDFRALFAPFYLFFGADIPAVPLTAHSLARNNISVGKKVGKILLALFLTAPLLFILLFLLTSADTAFESFVNAIDFDMSELIFTLILGSILLICTFPLLFAICKDKVSLKESAKKPFLSILDTTFANTVLVSVSLLYFVFLATQISYLGGGFTGLLPSDCTYSAYARRGFFEMCIVCVINLGIIFVSEVFIKRENGKLPVITRALNTFISGFSVFLITSAIAKMFMYIRTYGLTFLRLGTSIFMLLLFFVFGSLILKSFVPRFKAMTAVLCAACIIMSVTAIVEPYNIIASYNVYAYESGMMDEFELDTNYLSYNCATYGEKALISLAADENVFVANRAKEHLDNKHQSYYYRIGNRDIREMTVARYMTDVLLKDYYSK